MPEIDVTIIQATPMPPAVPQMPDTSDAQKPLETEEVRKARYRQELIDRQKDSGQKLSDFLLNLRNEIRNTDVDTRQKYLQDVDMMCRYVNGDQYGEYVNGVYQAAAFNEGDYAYTVPVINGHVEQAFMQLLRTDVQYEFAAKDQSNANEKLVAQMCEELAVEEKVRLMDEEARMDEIMNSILAGVSYRCLVWGVNPDAPKIVNRMSYTDEQVETPGGRQCVDCGYEVPEGEETCSHCGSQNIRETSGAKYTRSIPQSKEVALGENLLHVPNLLSVQRDLNAGKLKHATFVVERDSLPLSDAEWRYQTRIKPDSGAQPIDIRFQAEQARTTMQTDAVIGSARGGSSSHSRPVTREYLYLDPVRYGAFYNGVEETTPDGDSCPIGLLGDTYSDGLFVLIVGDTIIKLKALNFRRRWTEVFYGKRAGSSRGSGLQSLMPLNDIINDSFNLDYSLGMAGHPFTAIARKYAKDLPEINNVLFVDNVPPQGLDAVVKRFPGQAPTGFLGQTSQRIEAAMQFIGGTQTLTGNYGAPDNQVMSTATGVAASQENAAARMTGPIHQAIQADKEFMLQILENIQEYCAADKSPEQFKALVKRFGPDIVAYFFKCNFRQTMNINVAKNSDAPRSMALTQAKAMAFGQIAQAFARTEVPWAEDLLASLADTIGVPFDIGPGRTDRREAVFRLNKLAAIEERIREQNAGYLADTPQSAQLMYQALVKFCNPLMVPDEPSTTFLQDHNAFMDVYKDALFSEQAKTWSEARRSVVVQMWMLHFDAQTSREFRLAAKQRELAQTLVPPEPAAPAGPTPEDMAEQQDHEDQRMVAAEALKRHADEQAKDADSHRRMDEEEHKAHLEIAKNQAMQQANTTPAPPPPQAPAGAPPNA
jgi:hypothetical protein